MRNHFPVTKNNFKKTSFLNIATKRKSQKNFNQFVFEFAHFE